VGRLGAHHQDHLARLPPGKYKHWKKDRTVAVTDDGQVLTATSAGPSADDLVWRPLDVALPAGGFTTGIDVSPDGRSLAVVRGHDDADRLELVVVDLKTGAASTRSLDVGRTGRRAG
jgi:hypothetical protein